MKKEFGLLVEDCRKAFSSYERASVVDLSVNEWTDYVLASLENSPFGSDKARLEWLLSREACLFPEKILINRSIISAINNEKVLNNFYSLASAAIERGNIEPGCRTALLLQSISSPWVMGLNEENLSNFIYALDTWLEKYSISELIVMENPTGLGRPELSQDYIACRIECFSELNKIFFEFQIGTEQLRSLDKVSPKDSVVGSITFFPSGLVEEIEIKFGRNYTKTGREERIVLSTENGVEIKSDIFQETALSVASDFITKLISYWYGHGLKNRALALEQVGLSMIELQGKIGNDGLDWLLIYGLRGVGDERNNWANQFKSQNT